MNTLHLVTEYLRTLQEQGTAYVQVDDEARGILRRWMLAAKANRRAARPGEEAPAPAAAPADAAPRPDKATEAPGKPGPLLSLLEERSTKATDDAKGEEELIPFFRPPGDTPEQRWQSFEAMLPSWRPIQTLGTLRRTPVPGCGNRNADIMFVGEYPSYEDEATATPFRSAAGDKLDAMLRAMGLTREAIYLTLLVKFRPLQQNQTTQTRPPTAREIAFNLPILETEINLVRPKVIVALGVIAARGILGHADLPLSAFLSRHWSFNDIPVVVAHHPSYLLRTFNLPERRRLWEEMLFVMQTAGLPISPTQRNFFLPKATA
ncbi:MAG: uracil-DNA glycosylase [Akkermansia muciniphila]|nr:uracil-DNA glycosylase [Akkermansia muciniphila]